MGRSGSAWFALITVISLTVILPGCGSSNAGQEFGTPAHVTINPSSAISLDLGTTQAFTASTTNFSGHVINQPVSYHSTNTSVVTVANNGQACAGSWDSLAAPQVCTPGSVGVAQVTAAAVGAVSSPVTIYVHQHIDSVTIKEIPPPPPQPPPTTTCISKGSTAYYQASAFSRGADITSTVGQFTWQATSGLVASVSNAVSTLGNRVDGVSLNQVQVTAKTPGLTQLFASVASVNSIPLSFYTCPVESIALTIDGVSGNSFTVVGSGTKTVTPIVTDVNKVVITDIPLTWSGTSPNAAKVSGSTLTGVGTINLMHPGSTSAVASCTPPTCNIGLTPADPNYPTGVIYAENAITATATTSSATEQGQIVWVSTTDCSAPGNAGTNCITGIVPITSPNNVVGNVSILPATPNSFKLAVAPGTGGTPVLTGFLGTDSSLQGTRGLMVARLNSTTASVTQFPSVIGKVLAVSPDAKKVIVSDTLDTPNQVYVFDTSTNSAVNLAITGAVAADFSPDSLKAFIVANNGTASTLYVYSVIDALQTIPLSSSNPVNDVTFLAQGAFAYIAGGTASGLTVGRTCDNAILNPVTTPATPAIIKTLPNATQILGLQPPLIDVINVLPPLPITGCQPTINNSVQSFNLGQSTFTPKQLLVAPDGTKAYIVSSNLPSILVFDVTNQISSAIPLNGNTAPLQAALTLDGNLLYVAADDGLIHVLSTLSGGDIADISFPSTPTTPDYLCPNTPPVACKPDLIAIQP